MNQQTKKLMLERMKKATSIKSKKSSSQSRTSSSLHTPTLSISSKLSSSVLAQHLLLSEDRLKDILSSLNLNPDLSSILDKPAIKKVLDYIGYEYAFDTPESIDIYYEQPRNLPDNRIASVCIVGHVDHGKTTLIDNLRRSQLTKNEHGGITQHIGAFVVNINTEEFNKKIVIFDTPGHHSFINMRERGCQVADLAVLVVAKDDGVMPQTVEAINIIKKMDVPTIVAVTKSDLKGTSLSKINSDLLNNGIQTETLNGDTPIVEVSALKNKGINQLLETLSAIIELQDIKCNLNVSPRGFVIESKNDVNLGTITTIILKHGVLKTGQVMVAKTSFCKVRNIRNENGETLKTLYPGYPAQITGWKKNDYFEQPQAGDYIVFADNEDMASLVLKNRKKRTEVIEQAKTKTENYYKSSPSSESKRTTELPIIIKGDTYGTVEALVQSICQLPNKKVMCKIVSHNVGNVSKLDLELSKSNQDSVIIAYNVEVHKSIDSQLSNINFIQDQVIYKIIEKIKQHMKTLIPKEYVKVEKGRAVVLKIFEVTLDKQVLKIAGCRVINGSINKNDYVEVISPNAKTENLKIDILKHLKDEVDVVKKEMECGILIRNHQSFQKDDFISSYVYEEIEPSID